MTVYLLDLHEVIHTCPAWDQPHVIEIVRTIVEILDGGPCKMPVTTPGGTVIPCGDIRPRDKQCAACKPQIIVRNTTVDDRGYQGPPPIQGTLFEVPA